MLCPVHSTHGSRPSSVGRNAWRSAQRFMSIANKFGKSDPSHLTGLSMLALTELAMPSTPPEVQAEVERRVAAGEIVSDGTA
jgi:hypothetical protein